MSSQVAAESGGRGTIVKLPPASASATNTTTSSSLCQDHDVNAKIANRKAKMAERKRELLLEARSARIEWIHDNSGDDNCNIFTEGASNNNTNLLNELQACTSDILPSAPQLIESMLSSTNCDWARIYNSKNRTAQNNSTLRHVLEKQSLSWKSVVSKKSSPKEGENEVKSNNISMKVVKNSTLDLPSVPSPQYYTNFLNTLCEPSAANIVLSMQQFVKTIHEATNVMVSSMEESGTTTKTTPATDHQDHGISLAKAVRGFLNKTMREMEEHDAFHYSLYPRHPQQQQQSLTTEGSIAGNDQTPTMDAAAREELLSSLEKFVYSKCRRDIDRVLLTACEEIKDGNGKSMKTLEGELHDKMLSLQFVTPAHLEVQCLKSKSTATTSDDTHENIDLSYTLQQILSIHNQSSPRQMLQSILLAHRGVSIALDEACGGNGDGPPGADDILPTLILATLRAHPPNLLSSLRFIEDFAPMPLLRGETGYAYTNLCGAMQFIRELDMDGHMAEVISLEDTGEKSSVLSIGPDEFRLGLEMCRRKMKEKAEEMSSVKPGDFTDDVVKFDMNGDLNDKKTLQINITARDVRDAREQGETVDLDWAMSKQRKSMLDQGHINIMANSGQEHHSQQQILNIPPEEPPLPSKFSRSYSYLTAQPDNIGIRDLPKLLKEYKMLVHATEKLLNERSVWRESERKRQTKLERAKLEQNIVDVIGMDMDSVPNGH